MKKMFVKIKESAEEKLRKLCAGLSPEKRVPAIVSKHSINSPFHSKNVILLL